MATTAYIHGTIQIGQQTRPDDPLIRIPINARIPPETAGVFVFDYEAESTEAGTKIPVDSFLGWLAKAMHFDLPPDSLPDVLKNFTVAVRKLHMTTKGDFDIDIEVGTGAESRWAREWKPIPGLDVTLTGLGLEVTNMQHVTWLQDWIKTHAGQAAKVTVATTAPAPAPEPPATAVEPAAADLPHTRRRGSA